MIIFIGRVIAHEFKHTFHDFAVFYEFVLGLVK